MGSRDSNNHDHPDLLSSPHAGCESRIAALEAELRAMKSNYEREERCHVKGWERRIEVEAQLAEMREAWNNARKAAIRAESSLVAARAENERLARQTVVHENEIASLLRARPDDAERVKWATKQVDEILGSHGKYTSESIARAVLKAADGEKP